MRIFFVLVAIILSVFPAAAQTPVEELPSQVEQRRDRISTLPPAIEDPDTDLVALQDTVRELRREGEEDRIPLQQRVDQLRADLDRLGPSPEDGQTENAAIADERARLNEALARYDAALRQSDLNIAETQRLLDEIGLVRRDLFLKELLARKRSPLTPGLWADALDDAGARAADLASELRQAGTLVATPAARWQVIGLIGGAMVIALILWGPVRRRLHRMISNRIAGVEPLESRKVLVAASRIIAGSLPMLLGGIVLVEALRSVGVITPDGRPVAATIWLVFVGFSLVQATVSAVVAPRDPAWRIIPIDSGQAAQILTLFLSAVFLIGIERIQFEVLGRLGPSADLVHLMKAGTALLLGVVLMLLTRRALWRPAVIEAPDAVSPEEQSSKSGARLRYIGRAAGIVAIVATLMGYVRLGHFISTRTFYLVLLASGIWVMRALLREGVRLIDQRFSRKQAEDGEPGERLTYFWISSAIDVVALLAFIPPALLVLGADTTDVRGIVIDAFTGFNIGSVRISLANILGAIALIAAIIYATRLTQRTMEARVFKATRMDIGVQNSLKTLIGYVGLVIAFMVGVGSLGFDLSNLAIIAGALSVGIGFGLQSIVNNFVSGLILLFERPIKVGDWIVTSSGEGTVQKISVRSTEILTFDRSSIIVPNAELISNAVTNWTHKDRIGRVIIPVGISYDLDPETAIKALEEVAKESPDLMRYPAAYVYFDEFGDNSQNLQLRGYIRDVDSTLTVRTRLRVAIWKKFRERGIEIPFPQRDLHIRSGWPQTEGGTPEGNQPAGQ